MVFVGEPFVVLSAILLLPNETMCPPLNSDEPVPLFTTVTLVMLIVEFAPSDKIPSGLLPETIELSRLITAGVLGPEKVASNPVLLPAAMLFRTETVVLPSAVTPMPFLSALTLSSDAVVVAPAKIIPSVLLRAIVSLMNTLLEPLGSAEDPVGEPVDRAILNVKHSAVRFERYADALPGTITVDGQAAQNNIDVRTDYIDRDS
jgi:hypothetical protein